MTGPVAGIRRRRTVAGRRETPHLPPDRDFYGQTLFTKPSTFIASANSGYLDGNTVNTTTSPSGNVIFSTDMEGGGNRFPSDFNPPNDASC